MLEEYLPILIYFVIAVGFAVAGIAASHILSFLFSRRRAAPQKLIPYESGMLPQGPARRRFHIQFYLVAVLFILFDIEVVFLYPWAVVFRELQILGLIEMGIFIFVLFLGLLYVWRKGALEWE